MKRFVLPVLGLTLAIGGIYAVWRHERLAAHRVKYTTAGVTRGDVVATVSATGQLQPVVNVQVGSQVSGLIKELFADFNSPVKKGQVIARLDDAPFVAALHSAEGNLASAQSDLHQAQIMATRDRDLLARAMIAQSDMDTAESAVEKSNAAVAIAQANVEKARLDLAHCTITSPVDGTVTSRSVDVGQTVAASLSAPTLFAIAADLTKMQIIAEVAESDIGQVRPGGRVTFTVDAYPTRQFTGTIAQVRYAPRTIDSVVNYDTVINVANDDLALLPGMTANTSIVVAEHHDTLLVPNAALRLHLPGEALEPPLAAADGSRGQRPTRSGAGGSGNAPRPGAQRNLAQAPRTLYTLATVPGSKPERQRVRVGVSDGQMTEILGGIQEGDQIIVAALGGMPISGSGRPTNLLAGGGMLR